MNNDLVTCVLTSNANPCITGNPATSNSITMILNSSLLVNVSIESSTNPACEGLLVDFTAIPTNGGADPIYQWIVNGNNVGGNSINYSYIPSSGDVVSVVLTSSLVCATGNPAVSNQVSMIVNAIPDAPIITSNGITLMSNVAAGNQWYLDGNPITGATEQTYDAVNSGVYYDNITLNGCLSDTSNNIYISTTVGISEKFNTQFVIYPVPNNGIFTISASNVQDKFDLIIYNSIGKIIHKSIGIGINGKFEKLLDLRPISNGAYIVVLKDSTGSMKKTIIIND